MVLPYFPFVPLEKLLLTRVRYAPTGEVIWPYFRLDSARKNIPYSCPLRIYTGAYFDMISIGFTLGTYDLVAPDRRGTSLRHIFTRHRVRKI